MGEQAPNKEVIDDDQFFHLTCHVDALLKSKIERGEYVELECLLPKWKSFGETRFEWINKDGMTFLAPTQDRDTKINGIRKWDQAFRVYAAIYCNANPSRSGEIWQYIYTINSAASSFQWDNVAYYDTTFRQMMAKNPQRKWSKTYMQLWQLALCEPIQKGGGFQSGSGSSSQANYQGPSTSQSQGGHKTKTWHDRCCWDYNRQEVVPNQLADLTTDAHTVALGLTAVTLVTKREW